MQRKQSQLAQAERPRVVKEYGICKGGSYQEHRNQAGSLQNWAGNIPEQG